MLSDTMQVDNVKLWVFITPPPLKVDYMKKKNIPSSFCVVMETCCHKLHLTDVLSSEPCSFPCATGPR